MSQSMSHFSKSLAPRTLCNNDSQYCDMSDMIPHCTVFPIPCFVFRVNHPNRFYLAHVALFAEKPALGAAKRQCDMA